MDQTATPWRVFDVPSSGNGAAGAAEPTGPSGPKSAQPAAVRASGLVIAGVAGAIVVGAIAIFVAVSGSSGQLVEAPDRVIGGSNDTAMLAGGGQIVGGEIVVDVTGAVAKPGVYRLPAGSRVADAIDAAGGFSPRVDADKVASALNLAATLRDGSQLHVPARGESVASAGTPGGSGSATGSGAVNLNTASQSDLEALPGIGPVTAAKIIESRTATPFTSVDDLRERKLVGEKTFEQLQALVTVG